MGFLPLDLVIMDIVEAGGVALDQLPAQCTVLFDIIAGEFHRLLQPPVLRFGEDLVALRHSPE